MSQTFFQKTNQQFVSNYDLIVGLDSLAKGTIEGWPIYSKEESKDSNFVTGSIVGVLGCYNTGKTFVLQRLTNTIFQTQDDDSLPTGLSFKYFVSDAFNNMKYRNIVLDTVGTNRPINGTILFRISNIVVSDEQLSGQPFTEKMRYDEFLRELILELSDCIILVVGDMSWREQEIILNLVRKRMRKRSEKFAEVWIVHNYKYIVHPKFLERKKQEISRICGAELKRNKSETWFYSDKFNTRHLFLMKNEYGYTENKIVFDILRNWITSIYIKKRSEIALMEFVCLSLTRTLNFSKFSHGSPNSVFIQDNRIYLERNDTISHKTLSLYVPLCNVAFEMDGCYIRLYLPEMSTEDLVVEQVEDEMVGHFSLEVSGEVPIPEGPFIYDDGPGGKFNLSFNVPSRYLTDDPPTLTNNRGIITLFFKRKIKARKNVVTLDDYYINLKDIQIKDSNTLGTGGSGMVYLGKWGDHNVAVKKVSKRKQHVNTLNEVLLLLKFKSEYVVHCYGWSEDSVYYYIVLELMETDLSSWIDKNKDQITWKQKVQLIRKICVAMEFLHGYQIIHRDLKSKNVLLKFRDDEIIVKMADFDLSVEGNDENSIHFCLHPVGSLVYMAPEILSGGIYGFPSDLYAFGMVMYEILEEKFPFQDYPGTHIAYDVLIGEVRPSIIRKVATEYMNSYQVLDDIINLCWKADVKERPTFQWILEKLDSLLLNIEKVFTPTSPK